jgi:hypothetical protein
MELVATIPSSGVVAFVGLAGLVSQGHSRVAHPMVDGAVHPSCWVVFGRWFTVPIVTAWWCCLVCATWRGDDVCLNRGDICPISPGGVSGTCLP